MPHLIVEYSGNLPHYPEAEALTALNAALCAHPQVGALGGHHGAALAAQVGIVQRGDARGEFVDPGGHVQSGGNW